VYGDDDVDVDVGAYCEVDVYVDADMHVYAVYVCVY